MQQKGSIGFSTSSKALEDAFNKIQGELSEKKANWEMLEQHSDTIGKIRDKDARFQFDIFTTGVILGAIAKLGIEITEVHERLAKVEKAIKELKLGLK